MQINGEDFEPFVADHYRCTICGGDVHKDDLSDFSTDMGIHYSCEERYDMDPEYDDYDDGDY